MKVVVYGIPECQLCDSVYKLLDLAVKRGQIHGVVIKKPVAGDDIRVCTDNLTDLAVLGFLGVPAVVVYDKEGNYIWGMDKIKSIQQLRMSDIARAQKQFSEISHSEVSVQASTG